MNDQDELREKMRIAQDKSWEDGYFDGRDGLVENSSKSSWPSHYRVGFRAACEDKERKSGKVLQNV